jgi:hypothetical protein
MSLILTELLQNKRGSMGFNFVDLDNITRKYMLDELEADVNEGTVFISCWLREGMAAEYIGVLRRAITNFDESWFASEILQQNLLRESDNFEARNITIPINANTILAEEEFNKYYMRGVCLRAVKEGSNSVVVYRGQRVTIPSPESRQRVGQRLKAEILLDSLRTASDIYSALRVPRRPSPKLTVKLINGTNGLFPLFK